MSKKLRILWSSNAVWATSGYAQQSAEILPRINKLGYPLAASNFFGQMGGKFVMDGILQYPTINHAYGSDAMVLHGNDFNADVTLSLQDSWILSPEDLQHVRRYIPWLPVDHDPIPGVVLDKLKFAYRIIAMSKFGQKQLQSKGFHATYIPHTVDTNIFKPLNKFQRKKESGMPPDSFIIGMVAANKDNPPRKAFQEVLEAFKKFLEVEPKAKIYFHTNPDFPGGFPIKQFAQFLGLTSEQVLFPDPYQLNFNTGKAEMNKIYNCFDMLLCPSVSEGFGIPIIEAQACGVPVVVNNWTAMPELIVPGKTGYVCEIGSKWFSPQGSYMARPDVLSLLLQMVKVHDADRTKMGKAAREHIVQNYDTDTIFAQSWVPLLERIERELYPTVAQQPSKGI